MATEPLRVLSLGGGVQSSALLLMALAGEFGEDRPEMAVFADPGWERPATYDYLDRLTETVAPFPVHRVSTGNIREDTLAGRLPSAGAESEGRFATMPFYLTGPDGRPAMLRRQCTSEYKLKPIRRFLRERGARRVEMWLGISWDEWHRVRESRERWITNRFPLVDARLTRADCADWLTGHGYPVPPKSACVGCPFHNAEGWRDLKLNDPDSFARAVAFDAAIRRLPRIDGEVYLHRSLRPLDEVDFRNAEDYGQTYFSECEEGYCYV